MSEHVTYDPRHPHEPAIPPALDPEGRCLICGMEVRIEALEAENAKLLKALAVLIDPDTITGSWAWMKAREGARSLLAAATPAAEDETS